MPDESAGWIDVTVPLRDWMIRWPELPGRGRRVMGLERGDNCTLTAPSRWAHSGTAMDAPLHFIRTGHGLDAMPLSAAMGLACVIEIPDRESIKPDIPQAHRLTRDKRILLCGVTALTLVRS